MMNQLKMKKIYNMNKYIKIKIFTSSPESTLEDDCNEWLDEIQNSNESFELVNTIAYSCNHNYHRIIITYKI